MNIPARGEIWSVSRNKLPQPHVLSDLVLVVSEDRYNQSAAGFLMALPIAPSFREIPSHVALNPAEIESEKPAFVWCDRMSSLPRESLLEYRGKISDATLTKVEDRLRILLGL